MERERKLELVAASEVFASGLRKLVAAAINHGKLELLKLIGHLVDGSVTTQTFCNTGTVTFTFQTMPVNAIGTVEIDLLLSTLTPPLTDRVLITNNVPGGSYTITWDGLDGAGVQVPSGSTFPLTSSRFRCR